MSSTLMGNKCPICRFPRPVWTDFSNAQSVKNVKSTSVEIVSSFFMPVMLYCSNLDGVAQGAKKSKVPDIGEPPTSLSVDTKGLAARNFPTRGTK